jgi:hypothetical protein
MKFTIREFVWLTVLAALIVHAALMQHRIDSVARSIKRTDLELRGAAIDRSWNISVLEHRLSDLSGDQAVLWQQAHGNIHDLHERVQKLER